MLDVAMDVSEALLLVSLTLLPSRQYIRFTSMWDLQVRCQTPKMMAKSPFA
jgi:hypothetical protein